MDIYVQKDGQQQGPFPEIQIREGIDAGEFTAEDLAWTSGRASWQPLSRLLDLDVTKPPPAPPAASHSPANRRDEIVVAKPELPPPSSPVWPAAPDVKPDEVSHAEAGGSRKCKECGAPYKLFSLDRAMFSGLCVGCSPVKPKPTPKSFFYEPPPINSREDALKAVRNAGIFYACLVAFNIFMAIVDDPIFLFTAILIVGCTFPLCIAHSRVAAILLLVLAIVALICNLVQNGLASFGIVSVIVTMFQFGLTINAIKATFKLHKEFKQLSV